MIFVDTSAWIDYVNGIDALHTNRLHEELQRQRLATGDLIIAEFLQGFRSEKDLMKAQWLMNRLKYYDMLGREMALKSAENYRYLRKKGVTVRKTVDVMIGTFCIEKNFPLIHNDRDFLPMVHYLGLLQI